MMPTVLLLTLQLLLATPASAAQGEPHDPDVAEPSSFVEIPLRLSLKPLFQEIEKRVPYQVGNWRKWQKRERVYTKYLAWRGPLQFDLQGDVLTIQAHVSYWVMAKKRWMGTMQFNSSCGINEPPRQAIIRMQLRLEPHVAWLEQPTLRLLPSRFLNECDLSGSNTDVMPLIDEAFHKQLRSWLRVAIHRLRPQFESMRRQAAEGWLQLREPIELGEHLWLLLHPVKFAFSPVSGDGDTLDLQLAVKFNPQLLSGPRPAANSAALPLPEFFSPDSAEVSRLRFDVALDYAELGRNLTTALAAESFAFNQQQFRIEAIEFTADEQQLHVTSRLSNTADATVEISADVVFDAATQQLRLELDTLHYDSTADNSLQEAAIEQFNDFIRLALEDEANRELQQRLEQWKKRLMQLFDDLSSEEALLDISALQLQDIQINMQPHGVEIDGEITGRAVFGSR